MSHWSQDDTSWQDDAVAAWRNHEDPAPQEYAGHEVAPAPGTPDSDTILLNAFLAPEGVTLEDADPSQILQASIKADEYYAQAVEAGIVQTSQQIDRASAADEIALGQRLQQFAEEHNATPDQIVNLTEQIFTDLESGDMDLEAALARAGNFLGEWNGATDAATREVAGQQLGYEAGIKDAWARRRANAAVSNAPAATKPVDTSPGHQGLGNVRASSDALGDSIHRMTEHVKDKAEFRRNAKRYVLGG